MVILDFCLIWNSLIRIFSLGAFLFAAERFIIGKESLLVEMLHVPRSSDPLDLPVFLCGRVLGWNISSRHMTLGLTSEELRWAY